MQPHLLEEASKIVPDPQVLVNVVSKRVRQLSHGHRPLVDPGPRMLYSEIALRELISGKITYREFGDGQDHALSPEATENLVSQ